MIDPKIVPVPGIKRKQDDILHEARGVSRRLVVGLARVYAVLWAQLAGTQGDLQGRAPRAPARLAPDLR